jgi:hypothetical protein
MQWLAWFTRRSRPASEVRSRRLQIESLEERWVPYATSGNLWPRPERITISFQPDGTNLGGPTSNLITTFNTKFGSASAWQDKILQAAQLWAQQTNINFSVVSDNGAASGSGSYQQGDSGFGDIRIGGYSFSNNNLAIAYYPPPGNNYSLGGDYAFNTKLGFNINGSDYDVFTVALHEFGHSLGLAHATSTSAVMYSAYNGRDTALNTDDINGIRAIYGGARTNDSYDAVASNGTFAAATNITSLISTTAKNALLTGRDITTTTDIDYYKFTVPTGMTGTMTVKVQSAGLSLLTPLFKVYNNSQVQIGSTAQGTGYVGSTLTGNFSVTAGQTYYIMVDGKDATAHGTGRYALTLTFTGVTSPTVPIPNTQVANGSPLSGTGGIANSRKAKQTDKDKQGDQLSIDPTYVSVVATSEAPDQSWANADNSDPPSQNQDHLDNADMESPAESHSPEISTSFIHTPRGQTVALFATNLGGEPFVLATEWTDPMGFLL